MEKVMTSFFQYLENLNPCEVSVTLAFRANTSRDSALETTLPSRAFFLSVGTLTDTLVCFSFILFIDQFNYQFPY